MPRSSTVTWFEPYWSHHRRNPWTGFRWKLSALETRRWAVRLLAIGTVAFAIGCAIIFILFRPVFGQIFLIACAVFAIYAAIIPAWMLLGRMIIPLAHRAFPRWIRVSAARIEITDLVSKPLRINLDDLESVSLVTELPARRSVILRWRGGERTVGLSLRVNIDDLRALLGDKLRVGSMPEVQ